MSGENVELYLNHARLILRCFGVWPSKYVEDRKYKTLFWSNLVQQIYRALIFASQYGFLVFEFIYIGQVWGDLLAVSEASYLLFTQASLCFKATIFTMSASKVHQLTKDMDAEVFTPVTIHQKRILKQRAKKIKRLCMLFLISALSTCNLWGMIPLFDNAGNKSFPFKIWMPVDPHCSGQYEAGYASQMLAIYISAFIFIAVNSTILSMIIFAGAQIEVLMDNLKTIKPVQLTASVTEYRENVNENYEILIKCIKHYQAIIRFVEDIENFANAPIFFELAGSVGILCISLLRVSIVEVGSVQFSSMLNYILTMLLQIFLACWCGHELTATSEELRVALYKTPWYAQDNRFTHLLRLSLLRTGKPLLFRAGHYVPLSRPTFVAVLRMSYSYFAVLNQAKKE